MTPQLRFPEFADEWRMKKLGDIAIFSKGTGISKDDIVESGNTRAVRYGELYTRYNERIGKIFSSTNLPKESLVLSRKNDVIIPASGETHIDIATAACVLDEGVALSGDINIIRTDESGVFMAYYLNNKKKVDIARLAQGVSVIHLYSSNLKSLNIRIPAKPEQEKIAELLTIIDERIAASEKKVKLLQRYKKSVMQKIFSRAVRFKDENRNPYPEWKEESVSEFLKERKEYTSKGGDLEHISLTTAGVVPKSERYERDFLVGSEDKQYKVTRLNDICYNPANLKFGVIARNKYKDGIFSPIYVTYVVMGADVGFVEYLVTSRDFIQRARKYEQGTVYERMAVSPYDLAKLKVNMPCIEEQRKIAALLAALDDKIKAEQVRLTAAKQWKKGLLQRMFV